MQVQKKTVSETETNEPDFIPIPRLSVEAAAGAGALVDDEIQTGFYAFNRRWLARRQPVSAIPFPQQSRHLQNTHSKILRSPQQATAG